MEKSNETWPEGTKINKLPGGKKEYIFPKEDEGMSLRDHDEKKREEARRARKTKKRDEWGAFSGEGQRGSTDKGDKIMVDKKGKTTKEKYNIFLSVKPDKKRTHANRGGIFNNIEKKTERAVVIEQKERELNKEMRQELEE